MGSYYDKEDTWIGYVWSVTAAALSFQIMTLIAAFVTGAAAADIAELGMSRYIIKWCVFGVFYWTGCFITGPVPVLPILWVDGRYRFHTLRFYLLAGTLAGGVLNPVFMLMHPPLYWVVTEPDTFVGRCIVNFPWAVLCGIFGALAFWWRTGRHLGRFD